MNRCRDCNWYLVGSEIGCLKYGGTGRAAEVEQMKTVLAGDKCDEYDPLPERLHIQYSTRKF